MTTAIIGLGNIGSRVASNLVAGGENVIVAARDRAKAQAFAKKVGTNVEAMSIEDALKKVDVLILEPIQRDVANKISMAGAGSASCCGSWRFFEYISNIDGEQLCPELTVTEKRHSIRRSSRGACMWLARLFCGR